MSGTVDKYGLTPVGHETRSRKRLAFLVAAVLLGPIFLIGLSAALMPWLVSLTRDEPLLASEGEVVDADADPEEALTPRETYNRGVELLMAQDLDGAEEQFLAARDNAGSDAELRYRAAFDLGMTYAARADALGNLAEAEEVKTIEEAIEHLRHASAWFRDAVRLRPQEVDGRINLELVLTQIQRATDLLNRSQKKLEKQLARIIEDERVLRDEIRGLVAVVQAAGATREPSRFAEDFRKLASRQRSLITDANEVAAMAGDEIGNIEQTPEEERDPSQQVRHARLSGLVHYLDRARGAMSDARRDLRELDGEGGHRRVDTALRYLKRAADQLADPVQVLRQIASDQQLTQRQTTLIGRFESGEIKVDPQQAATAPAWLTPEYLAERETDVLERTAELAMAFAAASQSPPDPSQSPEEQAMLKGAAEAAPHLQNATDAMALARTALEESRWPDAIGSETEALKALALALERFSGHRELIELAWAEQRTINTLLEARDTRDEVPDSLDLETPRDADEISAEIRESLARNHERLQRLQGMFADEVTRLESEKANGPSGPPTPGQQPMSPEEIDAELQRFQLAEVMRLQAANALSKLTAELDRLDAAANTFNLGGPPQTVGSLEKVLDAAEQTDAHIEELRLLFLTLVEHVKDLARRQAETLDQTASVDAVYPLDPALGDSPERLAAAQPLGMEEAEHGEFAEELVGAMNKQAEAAGTGQMQAQPGQPDPQEMARRLEAAANEVSAAASEMRSGSGALNQMPLDLQGSKTHQEAALEHLIKAIQILEPPQNDPEDSDENQDQSQQQAKRKLQSARDREAERRRQKERARGKAGRQPVDKDW